MKKIKLGLVGAGGIARKHLEVIRAIGWMDAVGITSRTESKAQKLACDYEIPICAKDIDSLVSKSNPDALMVLVSEDQTFNVASSAMKYGIPLFIEKPAGLTPEENGKLIDLARKQSIKTMVGFNRRYYSIFHKGIELIRKNGPLLGVSVEGHERMWRVRQGKKFSDNILDNWIFANGTHTIDLLRFFGGEHLNLKSIAHSYKEKRGDQFTTIMEFTSGAVGMYHANWYSPGGWKVVLYGDGVTVEFKPLEKGFWMDKDFKTYEIEPDESDVRFKPGFFKQMEAFGRLVRDGKFEWPMLDLEGAYKTMLLAEQISSNASELRIETKNGIKK